MSEPVTDPRILACARAIYACHKFVRPWDHPETVRTWHPVCIKEATACVEAWLKQEATPNMRIIGSCINQTCGYGHDWIDADNVYDAMRWAAAEELNLTKGV